MADETMPEWVQRIVAEHPSWDGLDVYLVDRGKLLDLGREDLIVVPSTGDGLLLCGTCFCPADLDADRRPQCCHLPAL